MTLSHRRAFLVGGLSLAAASLGPSVGRAENQKMTSTKFQAGQIWQYQTRAKEPRSRILIQRVEENEKLGEIVHIRVTHLAFKGPKGNIEVLPHLPFSAPALRKCLTKLESSGNDVPSDYLNGYKVWREAFDAGKGGIFTLDVASVLETMEKGVSK
jgi:hypothetical protein